MPEGTIVLDQDGTIVLDTLGDNISEKILYVEIGDNIILPMYSLYVS